MEYTKVDTDERSDHGFDDVEDKELLPSGQIRKKPTYLSRWSLTAQALTLLNVCLAAILVSTLVSIKRNANCIPGPQPPWSPVREDGVIRHINTAYAPQKIFQSETSDEVEAAWEGWLKAHDHLLVLPKEKTENRLPTTVDAFLDPGYAVYGLAVHHQMHCLNHVRKTFNVDKFFPNASREMVIFHKNHCFDMLRQAIMCHGDVTMVHWWNDTYSYVDSSGVAHLTDHYRNLTPSQRAEGAFAKWDAPTQCRDLDAINAWALEHGMEDDKYTATVGQIKRSLGWVRGLI